VHITRTGKPLIRTTGGRSVAPCPALGIRNIADEGCVQLLPRRPHRDRLRRHRPARPLHRQPARFDRPPEAISTPRLTRHCSAARMHRYCAVPRGDGQAPSQGYGRPGPCCVHCEGLGTT
jgi:hypothetical protein